MFHKIYNFKNAILSQKWKKLLWQGKYKNERVMIENPADREKLRKFENKTLQRLSIAASSIIDHFFYKVFNIQNRQQKASIKEQNSRNFCFWIL